MEKRSRTFVFTENNPEGIPEYDEKDMRYLIFQLEMGEEGTIHYQGYVAFRNARTISAVSRYFPRAHIEIARGTEEQCIAYCTKEDTRLEEPEEYGVRAAQGKRTDLDDICAMVKEGKTKLEMFEAHPSTFTRYVSNVERVIEIVRPAPPRERDVEVTLLWGATGTGKTHRIMHLEKSVYKAAEGLHRFDGYNGEEVLFLDEFDYEQWPITTMNQILDKWSYILPCRYNNKWARWTYVAIATNQMPSSMYPNAHPMVREAFFRRLEGRCFHVKSKEQDLAEAEPCMSEWN